MVILFPATKVDDTNASFKSPSLASDAASSAVANCCASFPERASHWSTWADSSGVVAESCPFVRARCLTTDAEPRIGVDEPEGIIYGWDN